MYSLMLETLSANPDRSPFHRLDPNYRSRPPSPLSISSTSSSSSSSSVSSIGDHHHYHHHPAVRNEQYRRKLLGLHHAAFCTQHVGQACARHSHCLAHKRIFTHMNSCQQGAKCIIPGCAKARQIWTHFSTCTTEDCSICSVIPTQERCLVIQQQQPQQQPVVVTSKAPPLPRSPKASSPSSKRPGRPPLSPKLKYHQDLPPRSPPRSQPVKVP